MSYSRTTADYILAVLRKCGESTTGTSQYTNDVLEYLNKVHTDVICGGTIFDLEVDDNWVWAMSRNPYVLTLQPPYTAGTVTMTTDSTAITFSAGPTNSLAGWHLRLPGDYTCYRIMAHTAGSTSASIDSNYTGSLTSTTFNAFKIDYDIVPEQIYIETGMNDKIDFIESGSTQLTATLTAGTYTPAALATQIATQLNAAGTHGNSYSASYSSTTKYFTLTSNLSGSGSPVFKLLAASGTNAGSSTLPALGFDYLDQSGAGSYTSTYMLGAMARLVGPIDFYQGPTKDAFIEGIDPITMQEEYPVNDTQQGIPHRFAIIREDANGAMTVRFDRYVAAETKIEIPHVPFPRDLQNNTASVPRLPRKYSDILEYGAAFFLATDKNDAKAQGFMGLAKASLDTMMKQNRAQLKRVSTRFGEIIPRRDLTFWGRRRFRYGYTADE